MISMINGNDYGRSRRLMRGLVFIILSMSFIYACNHILAAVDFQHMNWSARKLFYTITPVGIDFKMGIYEPGGLLLKGQSPYIIPEYPYPPLTSVIGMLFALLPYLTAYLVQMLVLFVLNIATLWIAVQIMSAVWRQEVEMADDVFRVVQYTLFALILFMDLSSYGFAFSAERGNYDIYAQFFSVLGLWFLVAKPGNLWLPVLAVSLAVHCKIYPAVLFVMIFWRYRWKCLIPIVVTNAILFLILGPANLLLFMEKQWALFQAPLVWIGNHSATAFAQTVLVPHGVSSRWAQWVAVGLPVGIWLVGAFLLWGRNYHPKHVLLLFMLSVPLMNVLPGTSHDYKLVILYAPCLILLAGLLFNYIQKGCWRDVVMMAVLLVALGFLSRSFFLIPVDWLQNKYPFVLLIQAIVLAVIAWSPGVFRACPAIPAIVPRHEES